ncbi:hypothetical protein JCM11641_000688 [Rhodosporidiobolus odoratus]
MPTPSTPFGVTLRNDLEKFLPAGDSAEEAILQTFGNIAGNEKSLGFPVHSTKYGSEEATQSPPSPAPTVTVLRSQTPALSVAPTSTSTSRPPSKPKHDAIWERDHGPLPLSRLRSLKHPGVWDLRDPNQIHTICEQLDHRKFSYVIVGGGTAGLVLARRLSEDPENMVCVIEAGPLMVHDEDIEVPNREFKLWGSDLDWCYRSTPQHDCGERIISWPRGRLMGGCSNFNICVWNRAPAMDYDAWEKLGNKGWNWEELLEYHKRSESFSIPTPAKNLDPRTAHDPIWAPHAHGHDGPLKASYTPFVGEQFAGLYDALREDGLKEMDPNAGKRHGVGYIPATVSPESQTRSSSEAAYLAPVAHRPNLMIITNAQATSLVWSSRPVEHETEGDLVKAKEVQFCDAKKPEESYYARFTGEVILCGGSFNTPALLEISGVGDAHHLEKLGLNSVVDLPGVGENLQDHPVVAMSFKLKPEFKSLDLMESDELFADSVLKDYSHLKGPLTQGCPLLAYLSPKDFLDPLEIAHAQSLLQVKKDRYGEKFEIAEDKGRTKMLKIEQDNYEKRAAIEVIAMNKYLGGPPLEKGASYIGMIAGVQHALSRGHVHITSSDPLKKPEVDPRYLSHPFDAYHLGLGARYLHQLCTTSPIMAEYLDLEHAKAGTLPASLMQGDPNKGDEEAWEEYARMHCSTEHHPAGTCSMLPREDHGVVDENLKVYGTSNVRVADMSIIPLHIATHTQSTAYMIGEKASDIVIDAQMQRRHAY